MNCKIEKLETLGEAAWILSIPAGNVDKLIIQLTAYKFGKQHKISFSDPQTGISITLKRTSTQSALEIGGASIPANEIWLDAVTAMLLDVHLNGWSDTAHLDQDFTTSRDMLSLCVNVTLE